MNELKKSNSVELFEIVDIEEKLDFCNPFCGMVDSVCGVDICFDTGCNPDMGCVSDAGCSCNGGCGCNVDELCFDRVCGNSLK